jgi:dTDP-4-dehydrorhamnose 3,5-epimerase
MKFFQQKLSGVFLIEPDPFIDERGVFRRNFCEGEFNEHGIASTIKQCNVSENKHKHTLRGLHYQVPPFGEGKTLSCFRGSIYDIVVDVRPQSPTYLQWISTVLSIENKKSLHVPPGCANAFLTLEDNCLIYYFCSESYHPDAERGIRYDDPLFQFEWPSPPAHISRKDKSHPDFVPR